MNKVLILGATSAIAQETARCHAKRGDALYLVARDPDKLNTLVEDLGTRGAGAVHPHQADLLDFDAHPAIIDRAWDTLGGVDVCLVAHGVLPDQERCERDYAEAERQYRCNFLSVVSLLTPLSGKLIEQGAGTIAVISSVAGDRGRQSNYLYGSAMAAKSAYLQGLRNRLYREGVHVLTIKPGFVDTPMTAELEQGPLYASAKSVGRGIYRSIRRKRNTVYLPFFWRGIMMIIRHVPESVFKRMRL